MAPVPVSVVPQCHEYGQVFPVPVPASPVSPLWSSLHRAVPFPSIAGCGHGCCGAVVEAVYRLAPAPSTPSLSVAAVLCAGSASVPCVALCVPPAHRAVFGFVSAALLFVTAPLAGQSLRGAVVPVRWLFLWLHTGQTTPLSLLPLWQAAVAPAAEAAQSPVPVHLPVSVPPGCSAVPAGSAVAAV